MLHQRNSDLQPFLNRLTSRSVLSEQEQRAILDLPTRAAQVPANRDFVLLGEVVDHCCFVLEGLIGRFGQTSDGARQITALYIAGDMPDVHSVVQPRSGSALQALSIATILRVPHKALRALAARYPAIAEALWRDSTVDASILSQWVVNVGRRDARTRIAHLLCEMAVRYKAKRTGREAVFHLPLTQTHLADATGLTAVHVNRVLGSLRDEGIASLRRGTVHIFDWDRLAAAGEFDADYLQTGLASDERLRIAEAAE